MSDLTGTLPDTSSTDNDERKPQIQVNSLDYLVSVDRLPIFRSNAQGIYLYGADNNYPRKIMQSADRSDLLVTVREKQIDFIAGLGFPGATALDVKNDTAIIINSKGQNAYDLLRFFAHEKSNINVAIQVNYNMLGEATEFNLIQYDFVRRKMPRHNEKFIRHIITNIWHLENDYSGWGRAAKIMQFNKWVENKETELSFIALEVFDYNPDPLIVREQIELSGGIDNYPGQLFYKKRTEDVYQKALYDSLADKFQFLAESDLASLSNIQNGYAAGGIFKHFDNLTGTKEIQEFTGKIRSVTGAKNYGRVVAVPVPQSADMNIPNNMFEPTDMQNIDKLYEQQTKRAEKGIERRYSVPNSILGDDTEGNFATQNMQQAFDAFNTSTQPLRTEVEIELTTLFKNSIFKNQVKLPIEIEPLQFVSSTVVDDDENEA